MNPMTVCLKAEDTKELYFRDRLMLDESRVIIQRHYVRAFQATPVTIIIINDYTLLFD